MVSPAAREANAPIATGSPPHPDRRATTRPLVESGECRSCASLQLRIDELASQVLASVDASRGAEAEGAVAKGRVQDLEFQIHMQNVELIDLRHRLTLATTTPQLSRPARVFRRAYHGLRAATGSKK